MLEILSRRFFLKLNLSDHRSILTDLQETSNGNGGRYEHANPVSLKAQDGGDHTTMNRDYAWLMISSGSQIKFEDINQIDEDDMEEMDMKWNMALLSIRAYKFWKKTGKKISIHGSDVAGFDKSKPPKDLDNLIKSQRSDKIKDGLGYSVVPPPPAQLYVSSKKDLSWTGLPECADDTVTDYSRSSPTVESTSGDDQNRNPFVSEAVASPITPKPFIKFVKPKDSQSKSKTCKTMTPKKPPVKYAEKYRKPNKKPNVRGNQRNWNNLKTHQLGPDFVMKKKACFNCGDFNHLAYDYRKRMRKSFTPKPVVHRPYRPSQRPMKTNMNGARPNKTSFNK
nr:ribonuclease H-like domain-containing protein [Tanacetum cinerariifolium]